MTIGWKKILKSSGIVAGSLVLFVAVAGPLFVHCSPQFGAAPTEAQKLEYAKTGHYEAGVFTNPEPFQLKIDCHSLGAMMRELLEPDPNLAPPVNVDVVPVDAKGVGQLGVDQTRITWLGHSSFIVELQGLVLLLDPVFGPYPAPVPIPGRRRYSNEVPIELDEIPRVDAVVISHDHYDHLEYGTIAKLRERARFFLVPLGVGNHLRYWGVDDDRIRELDWWEETRVDDLEVVLTPSRHMSGRGFNDQAATLWGSWVLVGARHRVYFSGDGGYGGHFAEIGAKYGPFDVGLMECGQYNDLWRGVHMTPEETALAGRDVRASWIMPIHWGAFSLAAHAWTDPVERLVRAGRELGLPVVTPRIGESVTVGDDEKPVAPWWERYGRRQDPH
ncbi:MAG: MBL fold metallo-hydrolase [Nannocystaceae bacterium]